MVEEKSEKALIRKYLNAGGKIVFLGTNPLFAICNPITGVLEDVTEKQASLVLGLEFSPQTYGYGHHLSIYTHEGNRWGLLGSSIGFWPVNPKVVTNILALDENGYAASWLKNYGGPDGSGLMQLYINPAGVLGADFFPMRAAIEYGIGW